LPTRYDLTISTARRYYNTKNIPLFTEKEFPVLAAIRFRWRLSHEDCKCGCKVFLHLTKNIVLIAGPPHSRLRGRMGFNHSLDGKANGNSQTCFSLY